MTLHEYFKEAKDPALALREYFGLRVLRPMHPRRKARADMVNNLFDAMAHERGLECLEIFRRAAVWNLRYERRGVKGGWRRHFDRFLFEGPATCPAWVVAYCQQELAPKAR